MDASQELLKVAVEQNAAMVVISVAGELDDLTHHRLRVAVNDWISLLNGRVLVLDLTDVTFLGSAGLSVLATGAAELRRDNAETTLRVVTGKTPAVLRPLQVMGFDSLLALYDSLEEVT